MYTVCINTAKTITTTRLKKRQTYLKACTGVITNDLQRLCLDIIC